MSENNNSGATAHAAKPPVPKPKIEEPGDMFLNEARRARTPLTFHLRSGRQASGTVESFGRYSVLIRANGGRVVLHKHAIDVVEESGDQSVMKVNRNTAAPPGPLRPPLNM
jgi:host factor-I protein